MAHNICTRGLRVDIWVERSNDNIADSAQKKCVRVSRSALA